MTLPRGACATALPPSPDGVGDGLADGLAGALLVVSVPATSVPRRSSPENAWTTPYTRTSASAATIAALQFGPRRSARDLVSDSKTSVARGGAASVRLASNSASSGAGSSPTAVAMLRRWPRA